MKKITYHHGDLRNALIEAGLDLISKEGMQDLSMRKVAAQCGVSHNAPYMHFTDKDTFLAAICDYIDDKFTAFLSDIFDNYKTNPRECIGRAGIGYVRFMVTHPDYFKFMYAENIKKKAVHPSPFAKSLDKFQSISLHFLKTTSLKADEYQISMIAMWAMVQGLASLFVSQSIALMPDYEMVVGKILAEKMKI